MTKARKKTAGGAKRVDLYLRVSTAEQTTATGGQARFFDAEWECSQSGHYFRANFRADGEDAMRIFGLLGIGFLIWLAPAPTAVTVAETALQAPDATSPPQPAPA